MTRMSLLRFTERNYNIPRMKKFAIAFLLFASLAVAQAPEPKVSDATHAKIRDIQLQQKSIEAQYLQLQQQLDNMKGQYNALTPQLNEALDAAYKEAGVKREDYSLDIGTLKFSKIEKKAEEKKKP
jgi:hypothetical protein